MKSDQEKILEKYQTFESVKDCFSLTRIQEALALASNDLIPTPIRQSVEIKKLDAEYNEILKKYPDAITTE